MNDVVLVNDLLTGCIGERVLWDYMLEGIPNLKGVDGRVVPMGNGWTKRVADYININYPTNKIIIQNATFIPLIDKSKYTIVYLQDNLRGMGRRDIVQEHTLANANLIVTNSAHTAESYPEYDMKIIPIGIDDKMFTVNKQPKGNKITGIFVGSMNDVKGWSEVKDIIDSRKDIDWIVVTKHNESYNTDNCVSYSQISQEELSKLLQIADFFILGSPVETQCLAALEAGFCDLPIIMHNTGIFADMSIEDKVELGFFGDNLERGLNSFMTSSKQYNVRHKLMSMGFSISGMLDKWIELLEEVNIE